MADRTRRTSRACPITARLVADMISVAGADRLLTMDLHQGQIQGFFNIPVDELTAVHMLSNYFKRLDLEDLVVVTDLGFAKRARTFAEILEAPLAVIEKRRRGRGESRDLGKAELLNVIGEVKGKRAIIVDDEIDTASTLMEIERALIREGVTEIYACATHGVLSDPAIDRLRTPRSPRSSSPTPSRCRRPSSCRRSRCSSVAPLIGEAIKRIHRGESVGALFSGDLDLVQEMLLWDEREKRHERSRLSGDEPQALSTLTRTASSQTRSSSARGAAACARAAGTRHRSRTRRCSRPARSWPCSSGSSWRH